MPKALKYITNTTLFLFAIFFTISSFAQLPQQDEEILYILTGGPVLNEPYKKTNYEIWNFDPKLPVSPNNPYLNAVSLPNTDSFTFLTFGDLAVGPNIFNDGPEFTFYVTRTIYYGNSYSYEIFYYNGNSWKKGDDIIVGLGIFPHYINPFEVAQDKIYTLYSGSGLSSYVKQQGASNWDYINLVSTTEYLLERKFFYSIDVDCEGNIYLFESHFGRDSVYANGFNRAFRKYNSLGVRTKEWKVVNAPLSEGLPYHDSLNYKSIHRKKKRRE